MFAQAILLNFMEQNRYYGPVSRMVKAEAIGRTWPERMLGQKANAAVLIIVEVLEIGRELHGRRSIRLFGERFGFFDDVLILKGFGGLAHVNRDDGRLAHFELESALLQFALEKLRVGPKFFHQLFAFG